MSVTMRDISRLWRTCARFVSSAARSFGVSVFEVVVHTLDAPVIGDELGRRLLAHTRDARDVVGGVALERLVVDHLIRPEPVALGRSSLRRR